MQSSSNSRKRGAPGASVPLQPPQQNVGDLGFQPVTDFTSGFNNQIYDLGSVDPMNNFNPQFAGQQGFNDAYFDANLNNTVGAGDGTTMPLGMEAGQLVRRNQNQQLATRGRGWQAGGNELTPQPPEGWEDEDEAELDQRAQAAKRDAQAKRKQIPPFVQKLSSFLDESNRTDLIQWADDGRSFIVLDEEEFAKTLIPELFKHNNYASFVRQLNMYGFHKKVGLSDNSMKASENKRKTPSEYWNKYFRRGRPDLLWLIQKPKAPPTSKRKREDGKGDQSDDEKKYTANELAEQSNTDRAGQELTTIPKSDLVALRQELVSLQRQQKLISNFIGQIKRQNDQLYQQATAFQALHDRHESSINAILTFLATFYNRSLEGQTPANLVDMFASAMGQGPREQPQGNIVEMPDFPTDAGVSVNNQMPAQPRRRQLLLPAPDIKTESPTPTPPVNRNTRARTQQQSHNNPPARTMQPKAESTPDFASSPVMTVKSDADTPNTLGGAQDMLSVINAVNANSPAGTNSNMDFNSALEHFQTADGNAPLTPQQRGEMLNLIANTTGGQGGNTDAPSGAADNNLTNPQAPPMPSLPQQIGQSQEHLNMVQKLQEEQAAKVANLAERLGPLSPNGTIPGFHEANVNGTPIPAPDWNLDDWINDNSNSFDWDANVGPDASYADLGLDLGNSNGGNLDYSNNGLGGDMDNYGQDPNHLGTSGGRVESLSSRATTPNTSAAEDTRSDRGSPKRKRKRPS